MRNQYKLWFFSLDWIIYTKFQHSKKICARNFDFEKRISGGNLVLVPSTTLVRNRVRSSWSNYSIVWMREKVSYQVLRRRYSQIYAPIYTVQRKFMLQNCEVSISFLCGDQICCRSWSIIARAYGISIVTENFRIFITEKKKVGRKKIYPPPPPPKTFVGGYFLMRRTFVIYKDATSSLPNLGRGAPREHIV